MNDELHYRLNVEPAIATMLAETGNSLLSTYNISRGDYERAVWTWVMNAITDGPTPLWMVAEMARLDAKVQSGRVVEGEAVE